MNLFRDAGEDGLAEVDLGEGFLVFDPQEAGEEKVYSSKSGVWPGSVQPSGPSVRAMFSFASREFRSPTNSSMILGLFPTASIRVGVTVSFGKG